MNKAKIKKYIKAAQTHNRAFCVCKAFGRYEEKDDTWHYDDGRINISIAVPDDGYTIMYIRMHGQDERVAFCFYHEGIARNCGNIYASGDWEGYLNELYHEAKTAQHQHNRQAA